MSYNDNEINIEPEKSLDQFDQRNIRFKNISQECDINIINIQKNDLCLRKSDVIFDSKSFMRINSNYELISQDPKYNENILFSSLNEFNKDILPKLSVFYSIGKELLIKEIFKTGYGVCN